MFALLLRKTLNTKWLALCLLIGFALAAGIASAVPVYMDASLQRTLDKDMEKFQTETGKFPGAYAVQTELKVSTSPLEAVNAVKTLEKVVSSEVKKTGIPAASSKITINDNALFLVNGSSKTGSGFSTDRVKLTAVNDFSDFSKNITIVNGAMYSNYSNTAFNGVIEAIITEEALKTLNLVVGQEYEISPADFRESFKVKIAGTFEPNRNSKTADYYWAEKLDLYINALFIDYDLFLNDLVPAQKALISGIYADYALDYHKIDMNKISSVVSNLEESAENYSAKGYKFQTEITRILTDYVERAESLSRVLWSLQIPAAFMFGFYLFMISRLNVERERNEIALLKSRGASGKQIFALYAGQAGLIGLIALVLAPFIGLMLCKFLGVSDGFLEFVNRKGLPAAITPVSLTYAFIAVLIFFAATLIPIIPASKLSIVEYKRSRAASVKASFWEKAILDVILIAGSLTFLYFYNANIAKQTAENRFVPTGETDPLLFAFSSFFIIGCGLFYLRIYPYVLSLIYKIGEKLWNPSQYIALTSVRRSDGGERFLMMFLVVAFSLGIFSANTARTINNNKRDMLYYMNGADVVLKEYRLDNSEEDAFSYKETDISRYEALSGVEVATRVLKTGSVKVNFGDKNNYDITLTAVEPDKFAQTAWFRNDLAPIHWYNYCNALVDFRAGVIISASLAENAGVKIGDAITLKWGKDNVINSVVIAVVEWWSGINPLETDKTGNFKNFAIMNYNFVRSQTELEPYEIWLKMEDGASSKELYDDIKANRLPIMEISDASQKLILEKNDPALQGVNGALTLGFVAIMLTTLVGFLVYQFLSITNRALQFGVLRAMGMSFREIAKSLIYEQALISGISVIVAFIIGGIASFIFIPPFQNMYDFSEQIPPFYVAAARSDYIKIYVVAFLMLIAGVIATSGIIRKTSVNKALKLGED